MDEDYIEINSRDFMAALHRLLAVKYEKFSNSSDGLTRKHDIIANGFKEEFTLIKVIDPSSCETKS